MNPRLFRPLRTTLPLFLAGAFLGACAGTVDGPDGRPMPAPAASARPGVPVTIPGHAEPAGPTAQRPGGSPIMERRKLQAQPTPVRRAKPALAQSFWLGGPQENRRVVISLSHQVAQVWSGDQLLGQAPVSTGREGYGTPAGKYSIVEKRKDHHSSLYGEFIDANGKHVGLAKAGQKPPRGTRYAPSPMPYFMRMTWTGLGMHQGYLPGWPASHGCIRLPANMAQTFFNELPKGTPVEIVP